MAIKNAMWCHGHNLTIEDMGPLQVVRMGNGTHLTSPGAFSTWVHLAIPTAVLVNDVRLRVGSIILQFKTGAGARVTAVHVWDGENRIAWWDKLNLSGVHLLERFDVQGDPEVKYGLGISMGVQFMPDQMPRTMHIISVGCDFV
jgi:hypothetical protein